MRGTASRLVRAGSLSAAVVAILGLSLWASAASGAERVYWPNFGTATISFANLDASGDGTLKIDPAAPIKEPNGVAIDHATGRIYWSNQVGNAISYANLDGSGGGQLPTGAATVSSPQGVAIDPLGRRIYWANSSPNAISYANLDGSGSGTLPIGLAELERPVGVSIDPAGRRVYWTDRNVDKIFYANLDGSGRGELPTGRAPVEQPLGLAVDPLDHVIFWTNLGDDSIGFAALDGSGRGGALDTGDATVKSPRGIAVDSVGERVYWTNPDSVSFVDFDGLGGDFDLKAASTTAPMFPAVLLSPRALKPPEISVPAGADPILTCMPPEWGSEFLDSSLEAPSRFGFQWLLDKKEIPGATTSSLNVAGTAGGEYACRVTAENRAGTSAETSSPILVPSLLPPPPPSFGRNTRVTLALSLARIPRRGPVSVRIANANAFPVRGLLSALSAVRSGGGRVREVSLGAREFVAASRGRAVVKLKLPKPLRRALLRKHSLLLFLSAVVADPAANRRTVTEPVVAKLRTTRRTPARR